MTEEKKPHVFKPGDRVWFEGKKYTLIESSSTVYPLCLDGMTDRISFNEYGKQLLVSTKPSLKPVKKKKRQEVWVLFDEYGKSLAVCSNKTTDWEPEKGK